MNILVLIFFYLVCFYVMLLKNDNNRLEVCLDLQNYYINYLGIRCSLTEYWYDIKKKLLDLDTSAFNTY